MGIRRLRTSLGILIGCILESQTGFQKPSFAPECTRESDLHRSQMHSGANDGFSNYISKKYRNVGKFIVSLSMHLRERTCI